MLRHLLAFLATLYFTASASSALACSCRFGDAAAQLAGAQLMVIARAEPPTALKGRAGSGLNVTRFVVIRTIKGESRPFWDIAHGGDTCDVVFEQGREYAVLAGRSGEQMYTNQCYAAVFPLAEYEAAADAALLQKESPVAPAPP